jgi:phosphatidylserine/phosphatidylglycerophosphate/cardiolipin synthase-like enzyme
MITIDRGTGLEGLLDRAFAFAGPGTRLDVAVPFFDPDSRLWKLLSLAAEKKATVRILTRHPQDTAMQSALFRLLEVRAKVVLVPNLHAKALVWMGHAKDDTVGYVGSHNLTLSSEARSLEIGIVFRGRGTVEMILLRDLFMAFDDWEQSASLERRRHHPHCRLVPFFLSCSNT